MTDEEFFATHKDRQARIRKPGLELVKDKQRNVRYLDECELEFRRLGSHRADRRRIILWRVPEGNPFYDPRKQKILKIPMLLFADETVEDRDDVLLPLVHEIMLNAERAHG